MAKISKKYIWEKANGPVPKGHVLILKDGDPLNLKLDNLELITRAELIARNRNSLKTGQGRRFKGMSISKILAKGFRPFRMPCGEIGWH